MRDHKVQLSVFMKIWMCLIEGTILKNRHSFIFEIWACHTDILSLDAIRILLKLCTKQRYLFYLIIEKKPCIKKPINSKKVEKSTANILCEMEGHKKWMRTKNY